MVVSTARPHVARRLRGATNGTQTPTVAMTGPTARGCKNQLALPRRKGVLARALIGPQRTVNAGAPTGTVIPKGAKRGVLLSSPLKNRGLRNPLGIPALAIVYSRASIEKACSQFTRCTGATVSPANCRHVDCCSVAELSLRNCAHPGILRPSAKLPADNIDDRSASLASGTPEIRSRSPEVQPDCNFRPFARPDKKTDSLPRVAAEQVAVNYSKPKACVETT